MSKQQEFAEWEFLIGYPLEQAEELLKEENVAFEVIWTKAPKRASSVQEDAYVIAVSYTHLPLLKAVKCAILASGVQIHTPWDGR